MSGGQGRDVAFEGTEPEDYTKITPLFETDFSVSVPTRGADIDGTYHETLFREADFQRIAGYSEEELLTGRGAYDCAGIGNEALTVVKNRRAEHNSDKKILMLQDSFSWYLSSYLACDVGEVDIIYPPAFTGSIRDYIRQTKPDAVIMMLCERNIAPVGEMDYAEHTAMFDLR